MIPTACSSIAPAFLAVLAIAAALASPAPSAAAQPDPLQAGDLVLVPEEGRARLELPGGGILLVPLPEGAELHSLAALAGGRWAAAGSVPAAAGGRRLLLLRGDAAGHRTLAPPPAQSGRSRRFPVLLVRRGALAGLAWLEGDGEQSLGVRAARLAGGRWTAPEVVAPPGPGSQLALAGAVLADGSWLLAWSAFDGQDDEILWSRRPAAIRGAGRWSAPARAAADNRVPDITPALVPAGAGALLSWSRYDGNDYRLVMSRLAGSAWNAPATVGPAGSLFPTFRPTAGGPRLLYYTVRPRAWSLLELDAAGQALRRAEAAGDSSMRPVVTAAPGPRGAGDEVIFRWPGRREATAALQRVERPEAQR